MTVPQAPPATDDPQWVVLTRPAGRNAALAATIARAHARLGPDLPAIRLFSQPLLAVAPIDSAAQAAARAQLARVSPDDWLIFVSPRAVDFAAEILPPARWRASVVAAVGAATARTLAGHGITPAITPQGSEDSEGLLAALPPVTAGQRVWIVRGERGREKLAESLSAAGATVGFLGVYRRHCADWLAADVHGEDPSAPLATAWSDRHGQRPIWVTTSAEALDCLVRAAGGDDNGAEREWLLNSKLVVINARGEARARSLGFGGSIVRAGGPGDVPLAEAVMRLLATQPA